MNYTEINKKAWDKRTQVHIESKFYDVKGFIAGQSSLNPIELEQAGESRERVFCIELCG